MFDLKGKVALVTGAATGIGLAYVKELLRNDVKGVVFVDIDAKNGEDALGKLHKEFGKDRVIFVKADVSDRNQFEGAFETAVKSFKQLDVLINNAGIVNELQWEKCIDVNITAYIRGTMLAVEKYFPKYKSGSEGVVLNTASIVGVQPFEETPTYAATKHAVVGFTRTMGGELHYKTTNARILAICPGLTDTNIVRFTEKQVSQPYLELALSHVEALRGQPPDILGKHGMDLIKNAPSGSVWLAMDNNCVQVDFPKYIE